MSTPTEPRRAEPVDSGDDVPQVFAVTIADGHPRLDRRTFIELTAAGSVALVAGSCSKADKPEETTTTEERTTSTTTTTTSTTTTTVPTTTTTTIPPEPGTVPPGDEGIELDIDGETYTLPCGSPLPAGAVCTCNCVTAPTCSCVGDTGCGCVGDTSCATVTHYWYPN